MTTSAIWQLNLELTLLLVAVLVARALVRRSTKTYNAYMVWSAIPFVLAAVPLCRWLVAQFQVEQAPLPGVASMVQNYVVSPVEQAHTWSAGWIHSALLVWFALAIALLLRLLWQHWQLRKDLRRLHSQAIANPHIESTIVESINLENTAVGSTGAKSVAQTRYPIVHINAEQLSPAVYGFLRPQIYFPVHLWQQLSTEQIDLILRHEEQHIRQGHLWLNLLWDIAVCVFWFNPLLYICRQNFRHDQELYCDYLVLRSADKTTNLSYGHALLTTVSATHSVSLLCSWKAFNQLEERIMNIKRPQSKLTRTLSLIALFGIVASASVYSVNAQDYHNHEQHQPEQHPSHFFEYTSNGDWQIEWIENGK